MMSKESLENTEDSNPEQVLEGMRPEWHLQQFATVDDQAKAYVDLNKTLGEKGTEIGELKKANESMSSFFGAPDDGYTLPEVEGVEFQPNDPLMMAFNEFAKANNYSDKHYQENIEMYAAAQIALAQAENEALKSEFAKLDNAEKRISNINNWIGANVPEEHQEGLADIATSAAAVEALEWLLDNKAGKAPSSPQEVNGTPAISMEEIMRLQTATDENGHRKMQNPEYRARIQRLLEQHVGKGQHQEFVG